MAHKRIGTAADNPALHAKADKLLAEGGLNALMLALTLKQRRFVEEYVKDYVGVDALYRAGFTPATRGNAHKMASNLMGHPIVDAAIKLLSAERTKTAIVDVQYVLDQITDTIKAMADQRKNPKAAAVILRASELLARHIGMFVERTELTGKDGGPIETREVQEDADAFTRSIAGLADRGRTEREAGLPEPGSSGSAEVQLALLGET